MNYINGVNFNYKEILMNIHLSNVRTGQRREAKIGFSWTTLFFGCIPAFIRGDVKYGLIQFLSGIFTLGTSHLVFSFIYNKFYIKDLLMNGYMPSNDYSKDALLTKGFYFPEEANFISGTNS